MKRRWNRTAENAGQREQAISWCLCIDKCLFCFGWREWSSIAGLEEHQNTIKDWHGTGHAEEWGQGKKKKKKRSDKDGESSVKREGRECEMFGKQTLNCIILAIIKGKEGRKVIENKLYCHLDSVYVGVSGRKEAPHMNNHFLCTGIIMHLERLI